MHAKFDKSTSWQDQRQVLDVDMDRMPPMCYDNVVKIIKRFAATSPYAGYTQGNLYLVYVLGLVFSDERSVYWAFAKTVRRLHRYGPTTPYGTRMIPEWVIQCAPGIDRDLCDTILRLRWLYIMFGQTFTSDKALLSVWDYCMHGDTYALSLCAALLVDGQTKVPYPTKMCLIEYTNMIVSRTIDSEQDTAALISQAQLLLP